MSTPCGVGAVMIQCALQRDWQTIEIILALNDVIICPCLEGLDGLRFVAGSRDYDHGNREVVFTNVAQERKTIAAVQVHIGEHEIERL